MASIQTLPSRAVARNEPCPCGSGKRYKDCHGSLRDAAAAPSVVRKSRYRPEGSDWNEIGDDEQDRLGALMELALKHQVEGRSAHAERAYRAVLEQAPHTHDALHMLAVVRLGLGDYTEAERLIKGAMRLRPSYPAIETNWSLVRRTIAARDRRGIELLSEAALPLLFDSLHVARANRPRINRNAATPLHLVPCTGQGARGSSFAGRVAALLAPIQPQCWHLGSTSTISHQGWQRLDLRALDRGTARQPRAGDVILVGVEDDTGWLREPIDHVLIFVLATTPSLCLEQLRRIAADGARSIALVFDSHARAKHFGRAAFVLPPPIDITPFFPAQRRGSNSAGLRISTVGQDGLRVVSEGVEVMKAIANGSDELHLFDPGPLRYEFGTSRTVKCVARSEMPLATLLDSVDVHLHRPVPWWAEDFDHLFEAMGRGVPVLCHRDSIYAEYIDDAVDGWLYDDAASAVATLDTLRENRLAVAAAGVAAREKVLRMFDPRALREAYVGVVQRWRTAG